MDNDWYINRGGSCLGKNKVGEGGSLVRLGAILGVTDTTLL